MGRSPDFFSKSKLNATKRDYTHPDADIDEQLNAAMTADSPEVLQKIKAADQQVKVEMKNLDINLERLAYDDAASARQREIEVKDKMPGVIAVILFLLFGATLWGLFTVQVPEANKAIVYSLVGSLGTMTVTAAAYYHGTTGAALVRMD